MIKSIEIKNYRGLERLSMKGLGQINLLVGKNNAGKTSVLEALYLLATEGNTNLFWQNFVRRGEMLPQAQGVNNAFPAFDTSHLFYGHEPQIGSEFSIVGHNDTKKSLSFKIETANAQENLQLFNQLRQLGDWQSGGGLIVRVHSNTALPDVILPIGIDFGLRFEALQTVNNVTRGQPRGQQTNASLPQYISTDSLGSAELVNAFGAISLTPFQEEVTEALRFIEPSIEQIAIVPITHNPFGNLPTRNGFKVKLKDFSNPVPIGNLGDGIWRMLALSLIMVKAKDSIVFIDEIDTGFHYSTMENMWKFIFSLANKLNIQVFATTHSNDCINSLAVICDENVDNNSKVTIQRIEKGQNQSVTYSEAEIKIAASRHIEVR